MSSLQIGQRIDGRLEELAQWSRIMAFFVNQISLILISSIYILFVYWRD